MTHLYRHFDKNGTLLYIGISISAIYRFGVHTELCSDWIEKTTRIEIERFLIRQHALEAEKKAIINELPLYNYAHNKNVVPRRIYKPRVQVYRIQITPGQESSWTDADYCSKDSA